MCIPQTFLEHHFIFTGVGSGGGGGALLTPHFHFPLELYVYITLTNHYLGFFIYQLIILWTIPINWHRWLLVNNQKKLLLRLRQYQNISINHGFLTFANMQSKSATGPLRSSNVNQPRVTSMPVALLGIRLAEISDTVRKHLGEIISLRWILKHRLNLFVSVPTSGPQLVYQRPWYVLFCLWKSAYKRSLAAYRKE